MYNTFKSAKYQLSESSFLNGFWRYFWKVVAGCCRRTDLEYCSGRAGLEVVGAADCELAPGAAPAAAAPSIRRAALRPPISPAPLLSLIPKQSITERIG